MEIQYSRTARFAVLLALLLGERANAARFEYRFLGPPMKTAGGFGSGGAPRESSFEGEQLSATLSFERDSDSVSDIHDFYFELLNPSSTTRISDAHIDFDFGPHATSKTLGIIEVPRTFSFDFKTDQKGKVTQYGLSWSAPAKDVRGRDVTFDYSGQFNTAFSQGKALHTAGFASNYVESTGIGSWTFALVPSRVNNSINDIALPELVIDVPIAKSVAFQSVFDSLAVTADVLEPSDGMFLSAQVRRATLSGRLRNAETGEVLFAGTSTASARLQFTDEPDPYVFWETDGFDVSIRTPGSAHSLDFNTGKLGFSFILSDLGLAPSDPVEQLIRESEAYIHRNLSNELFLSKILVVEDPGETALLITDPKGRSLGERDGALVNDIPGTYYDPNIPIAVFLSPSHGTYTIEATGLREGPFVIGAMQASGNRERARQEYSGVLAAGETKIFSFETAAIPEPASLLLAQIGFCTVARFCGRRRDHSCTNPKQWTIEESLRANIGTDPELKGCLEYT